MSELRVARGVLRGQSSERDRPSLCEAAVNAADLRRKHFHAPNGERLTCFDAYESLLHRTSTGRDSAVVGF